MWFSISCSHSSQQPLKSFPMGSAGAQLDAEAELSEVPPARSRDAGILLGAGSLWLGTAGRMCSCSFWNDYYFRGTLFICSSFSKDSALPMISLPTCFPHLSPYSHLPRMLDAPFVDFEKCWL